MSTEIPKPLKTTAIWLLRLLAVLILAGTAGSMTDANQWWIRMWDFPRLQILIAIVVMAVLLFLFDRMWRPWFSIILLLVACWQFYRIYPYTPLAPEEVAMSTPREAKADGCFKALTFNVLQKNRDYEPTLEMLRREDADVLLLLETDQKWADALAPVLDGYSTVVRQPLDNTYGLIFASRLPASEARVTDLAQKDTPSAFATLSAGGRNFKLIGLHPRPPHMGQDTEERDAEIVMAARHAADSNMPAMAIGDFNDVAWSDTSILFKSIGRFLDPRIGRGTYATFPADKTWLGWPLDHLFVTEEFLITELKVLENVGSDHRPIASTMCLSPGPAIARNEQPEAPTEEDQSEAEDVMEEYREDTKQDAVEGE
ncbi:endonuclease/exonuclease/phosphatase family protein [Pontixanthobacter aestiaquae]|uniref:Endonuclease n=1 Tax=Pontixanthobacter aestiaquae TaxID=1509367 RepID=A0A844ZAT8_9SPHN|nr:endonuclease/exonuclease/phosphatase family protein [Pontixanthobacter aestiaquae]MDN3645009.1 endonuclease/exonuclease/phosphatase family protein [Pontixanthobacter aestiaquae]MXO83990.1 endonuclease [Pontixanthobacter aestiaquae]